MPHPGLDEVKKVYASIKVDPVDLLHGKVRVHNKYNFIDLGFVHGTWTLDKDGKEIRHGDVAVGKLAPGATQDVDLGLAQPPSTPGAEYILTVTFRLAQKELWADEGHLISWDQFKVPFPSASVSTREVSEFPAVQIANVPGELVVSNAKFSVAIDELTGDISSYTLGGRDLLTAPLSPNYWRAPTDNDRGNSMHRRLGVWKLASENRYRTSLKSEQVAPGVVKISTSSNLPAGNAVQSYVYTIYGDGSIEVASYFDPGSQPLPELPRFGMQMRLLKSLRNVAWYGRGPQESYWDRKDGEPIGIYKSTVENMWFPYVEPQETGNHTDTRWVTFTDDKGFGFKAVAMPLLSFSAWPFRSSELDHEKWPVNQGHKHSAEVEDADDITVNLDYGQMGVGGDDSWGAPVHREFTLPATHYAYSFRLEPLEGSASGME
jgi:beta-galactosidase